MGLFSFLSKKSYPDLKRRESLKTSAYDATVASSPPILGTVPYAGNGSKILEQFQKSHPNLATVPRHNSPAPKPLALRPHNVAPVGGLERPKTAPSRQPTGEQSTSTLQSSQTKSTLPPPPAKKFGPYKLPSKISTDFSPLSASVNRTASPGLASIYSSSIPSHDSNRNKGYVDLLDAQSMIRPADFYSRVQATGAKSYGEDVADRNKEHISHVNVPTTRELPPYNTMILSPFVSRDVDDDSDDERPRHPRVRYSIATGLRSKYSNNSHVPDLFPKRTSSRLPLREADEISRPVSRAASARSERASRRQSMPSRTTPNDGTPRSLSAGRKVKAIGDEHFPDALKDRALVAATIEREPVKPNTSNKRQSTAHLHFEHRSGHQRNDSEKTLPDLPASTKDHSRRMTISSSNLVVDTRVPVKRQSLQGIRSRSRGEIYEDSYQQGVPKGTQFPRDRDSSKRQLGSTTDLHNISCNLPGQQPGHKPQMRSSSAKATENNDRSDYLRKQSIASLSNKSMKAIELESAIPERNSSLRHGSLTSETAISTISSNPFRPQSGHTANTSVDFTPRSPHAYLKDSIPPMPDVPLPLSVQSVSNKTAVSSSIRSYKTAPMRQSSEFYLDDYASSDDDTSQPLSRGSYERELVFKDAGYGITGSQLPGLTESFDVTVPTGLTDATASLALQSDIRGVVSLLQIPAFVDYDSEDSFENGKRVQEKVQEKIDSSDDDMNFDIPMSRAASALRRSRAPELSPKGGQIIKEEDDSDDSIY